MDKRELPIQITVPKSEYIPYCDDLVRIVTIQFVIQFMMMMLRGASSFDTDFRIGPLYFGRRQYVLVDSKRCLHSLRPNVLKFSR
jgi:hypothetical protein